MIIKYTKKFTSRLKKQNVRIRKSFKKAIIQFSRNPNDSELNNHALKREWIGHQSINITADFRAIYKEVEIARETVVYFVAIGSHKKLYK